MTRREVDPMQDALFAVDTPPVKVPKRRGSTGRSRPVWTVYHPKNPVKCDDCMLLLAERYGDAPASRNARWKRSQGGTYLLLCYAHANLRRTEDGMDGVGK